MADIFQHINRIQNGNEKAALCIIIASRGSAPRKTGAKMLVWENGKIEGTIGGGALEFKVIDQAIDAIKKGKPVTARHQLVTELGMCCGGTVEIYIEPIVNRKKLYVFGAGHIGKALAAYASGLDFDVFLIDERYDSFDGVTPSVACLKMHHREAFRELSFHDGCYIAILTHNHAYDREILSHCIELPHAYLGMIGSMRKVEVARKNLLAAGISEERLSKVDMPMGIPMKAVTPQEIAISIMAKLVDTRNHLAGIDEGKKSDIAFRSSSGKNPFNSLDVRT